MTCYVHSFRDHLAVGYIIKVRRKWVEVRVEHGGSEFDGECRIDLIAHGRKPEPGSYVAISNGGKVHLCSCVWTKAQVAEVNKRADELWAKFRKNLPLAS